VIFKSLTTPDSYSMVVIVPVEPWQKTVTKPSVMPDTEAIAITLSVMSMMSVKPLVVRGMVLACVMSDSLTQFFVGGKNSFVQSLFRVKKRVAGAKNL
jgi:hypothetical protein